jgi:hypothetical protein
MGGVFNLSPPTILIHMLEVQELLKRVSKRLLMGNKWSWDGIALILVWAKGRNTGPLHHIWDLLEHLHRHSVRVLVLKILDEVQLSNPVDPLEDWYDPQKLHTYQSPGGSREHPINTVKMDLLTAPYF